MIQNYTSPQAIDAQADKVIMNFEGTKDFMTINTNKNSTFTLNIHKEKLDLKTKTYVLSIKLEDDRGKRLIYVYKININVLYFNRKTQIDAQANTDKYEK